MSEVYEGYERQYCELSNNLSQKCNSTSLLPDGVEKNAKVNEIKSGLDACDVLIRKMDLEASLQSNVKAMLLAKLREYKSDLNKLKREFKRITSGDVNQASRHHFTDCTKIIMKTLNQFQNLLLLLLLLLLKALMCKILFVFVFN